MRTLDLRGMILPFVLLKVSNAFKEIDTGETLEILLEDPDSMRDLLEILPPALCKLTTTKKIKDEKTSFCIQLLKQPEGRENLVSDLD